MRKHGVDFLEAVESLSDPRAITRHDPDSNGEERFLALAMSPLARLLVTVFTFRGDKVRVISARKASASECRGYLQR